MSGMEQGDDLSGGLVRGALVFTPSLAIPALCLIFSVERMDRVSCGEYCPEIGFVRLRRPLSLNALVAEREGHSEIRLEIRG